jgi:DNA-binding response OmpR family regulator
MIPDVPFDCQSHRVLSVQDVVVDPVSCRVWRDGTEVRLSKKEFQLLHALIRRPGEIVTREQLMLEVWDTTFWTSAKTIDVHLGWLRRKLGDDTRHPTLISTIRGRGLRFEVEPPARSAKASQAS